MQEFRQTPLNAQFSDELRYRAAEMFADVEQGHLWVSAEEVTIIPFTKTLFYGFAFLVMHDYDHYVTGSDWSLEGEITAYKAAASRAPTRNSKILYSQIVLRAAAYIYLGHAPEPKTVFNILQHRVRQAQMSRFSPPAYSVGLTSVHTAGMETVIAITFARPSSIHVLLMAGESVGLRSLMV